MLEFEIQKCTRHCAETGAELKPGDVFYSVLTADGADFVRRDYCAQAWQGPPEDAIGWWTSHVPDSTTKKVPWAPNDVMLNYFGELDGRPESADTRYVLTLLMIRRRVFRLEETEKDENGQETLILYCPKNESEYRVPAIVPSQERIEQIQTELAKLLLDQVA